MGTDSKTGTHQPSSKVTVVSSSSSAKNIKKKKTKTSHHKSKHNKQTRSESSSSRSSDEYVRNTTSSSSSKKPNKTKNSKDKTKLSSSNETRNNNNNNNNNKKSSNTKKKSQRSKRDSSESSPKRNNTTRSRSKSRSRSERSSDRSSSRETPTRYRHKNSLRRSGSNMQNVYAPMPHSNFPPNMPRHYLPPGLHPRGGRMPHFMPSPMMGGPPMRNNNGNRRSNGNSPPQSLLGGYRPPSNNFRGRGGSMNNPAYVHNMANMLNLLQQQQQQQQKQKPGAQKFANPNNPNNRFYQQFQDNYKKISSGQKISNLYQASFPVQHIPREMRFNFRLLGRNIFTASDEEEEEQAAAAAAAAAAAEKRSKQRRDSSSSSNSHSDDNNNRRRRRDEDNNEDEDQKTTNKSRSSPAHKISNEQKRSSAKNNRNRTASTATPQHSKPAPPSHEHLSDQANLSSFLAGIMQGNNSEMLTNTLVNAAVVANNKRERSRKQQEEVQKFKSYARFQQRQAVGGGTVAATNVEEVEKKIHGLARRLQMKTIGLHDDYESHGMKRSDESSGDSDTNEHRHRSSGSSTERSKDKDGGSDASTNSQRQRKLKKTNKRTNKKMNAAGQLIGSSDSEQHRSDGNDSDRSMLNLNEDLKPIGYYIKDRERMLHEMFRCVRGHKLQAILPDVLKTRSLDEIKGKCLDQLDIVSKKRIRTILLAQPMTSSSGTEDSTDEDEQDFFTLYPHLKSSLDITNNNAANAAITSTTTPPSVDTNKKSLLNSKFRPMQMHAVTENPRVTIVQNSLSAPVVVGGDEDVNDYYEGFKRIKKLASLRRNEQDDEFLPFPDQSGKFFQPIGSTTAKFEFKPITGLTHSQQAHLKARRAANRQQQQNDVRKEIEDLLDIDDFVLPDGQRPLSSAELSTREQRRYGLPPRLHHKIPVGPPKKGSLGDLLKQKNKQSGERSPSPMIDERNLEQQRRRRRQRQRSRSLSSTGSAQWSRSSSLSNNDDRLSRHSSREIMAGNENPEKVIEDDIADMNDLSKLLDLNEEDELLLLQIEVEQEERNIRREEKRRRKEEKQNKKLDKKLKLSSSNFNDQKIVQQCINDLIENIILQEENKTNFKRTLDYSNDELSKKIKLDETN